MKQPPKNASNRRVSTSGSADRSLIMRNSIAGRATAKTNLLPARVHDDRQKGRRATT